MSGPLAVVREFFVAPAAGRRERETALPAPPPSYAVLGERGDAGAVAAGLVLAEGGTGTVCTWALRDAGPNVPGPSTAAARRLARRLTGRGLDCAARGRLAAVDLPSPPDEAVAAARRAAAAADMACAVVLAGPRDEALDTLLGLNDAIVLASRAGPDSPLIRLAEESLAGLGPPVVRVAPPAGVVRRLALAGLVALPSLRAELAPALAR